MEEPGVGEKTQPTGRQPTGAIGKYLQDNFQRLPKHDQFFFKYSPVLISINSAVCGVMANSLFRRALKVRKYFLLSCLPVAVLPPLMTGLYHETLITQPLIEGTLNCPVCAVVRSAYNGVFVGGVAPIALAGFVSLQMVPSVLRAAPQESILRAVVSFTKPIFSRLKYVLLFQAITSVFVASRQVSTLEKVLLMAQSPELAE